MARIRTVKPEFWEDETIGTLSRDARLLFIATFNMADDEGLLRWTVAYIKAQAFLYDEDMPAAAVSELMTELVTAGVIYPYRAGKAQQQLGMIVNFHRHQRVNRPQPSKLPPPSWNNNQIVMVYARRDLFTCHLCGHAVNETWAIKVDPYGPQTDLTPLDPSPDHVTPRSLGGTDHPSNIKTAHVACNKGRGNRSLDQFKMPDSVAHCLRRQGVSLDSVNHSLTNSVNGAVPSSQPEGKGREGKGREGKGVKTPVATAPDPLFDDFWSAYPRKTDKSNARKSWEKALRKTSAREIIAAAAAYAATNPDPKFTAHASTWLNGERWDDELARAPSAPPRVYLPETPPEDIDPDDTEAYAAAMRRAASR